MIARLWRATTTKAREADYLAAVQATVLPHFHTVSGYRGALFLIRDAGDSKEIRVLTFWDSIGALHALTGPNHERAFVPDMIRKTLNEAGATADHFDVAVADDLQFSIQN
jgi:hypothetical protein